MLRCATVLSFLLAACAGERVPMAAPATRHYALLPDADAGSPVRIEAVEELCRKVEERTAVPLTGIAFVGQRLRWLGRVDAWVGRRLVVGVGRLRVELRFETFEEREFAANEIVEVAGVIAAFESQSRRILLAPEATAAAPAR
jgi:hypothetical protein